jgi:hypothetical protein
MRARALLPVLALVLAAARPAAAQSKEQAAALFQEGREAAKRGDYTTACAKMEESYRLDAAHGTLINLADCQERLDHLATAAQRFQEAADKLDPNDDRLPAVKQRIAALAPRVPKLIVELSTNAPVSTRVTRDGILIAPTSLKKALSLDPGPHVIVASADGREDRQYRIDAGAGRTEHVVVEPGPPAGSEAAPGTTGAPASGGRAPLRIAGFVVGGVGLAFLGAAVGTGLVLPSKQSTVNQNCGPAAGLLPNHCNATGFDAAQSGKTLSAANTATWVVGGIAVATGVTLVVVGFVGKDKPAAPVPVGISAGLASAAIRGRF